MVALFTLGGVTVSAKKVYADLSSGSAVGNATWTSGTNTFAWTAGSYAYMVVPGGSFTGDLSEYTTVGLTVSGLVNEFRVDILANGKTFTGKSISSNGSIVLNILEDFNLQWNPDKITKEDLKSVTAVRLNTNSASGSAVITDFYVAKPAALLFNDAGEAEFDLTDLVATGGLSFDEKTGVLTNDGTGGTLYVNMPAEGIDFTHFTSLIVNHTGDVIDHSEIKDTKNNISNGFWGSKYGVNFTTGDAMKFNSATNVNSIVWYGNNAVGTMTISSIKVKASVITCSVPGTPVSLNTLQYHNFPDGTNATATWNVGTSTDTYYGSGSSNASNYVDLTDYEVLRIHRDDQTDFRAFFINAGGSGTNQIDGSSQGKVSWNDAEKYWEIDLSKVEKYQGKVYLNTIKSSGWGTNNIVNGITLYKTPEGAANYLLAGKGTLTPAAAAALADPNAKIYDATGVTGTNLELHPANPNALFVAKAGVLANANNVVVDGTCANLVLTDGHPFKAPADFTATSASYTTTINATAQAGTLCLPFAATIPEGVTAYTLAYTSGDAATATAVKGTIPANTPVLLNGSGAASFTGSNVAVAADATNAADAMTGVFEATGVPTGSYVLQMDESNKVGFYKVDASDPITAQPFRAYLTAQNAGAALRIVYPGDATGIEAVEAAADSKDDAYYTLSGVRVSHPVKGLYIKNGKKVMVK